MFCSSIRLLSNERLLLLLFFHLVILLIICWFLLHLFFQIQFLFYLRFVFVFVFLFFVLTNGGISFHHISNLIYLLGLLEEKVLCSRWIHWRFARRKHFRHRFWIGRSQLTWEFSIKKSNVQQIYRYWYIFLIFDLTWIVISFAVEEGETPYNQISKNRIIIRKSVTIEPNSARKTIWNMNRNHPRPHWSMREVPIR